MHCYVLLCVDLALVLASTLSAIFVCSVDMAFPTLSAASIYVGLTLAAAVPILPLFRLNRTVWRFTSLGDGMRVAGASIAIMIITMSLGTLSGRMAELTHLLPILQALIMLHALAGARIAMRVRHDLRQRKRKARSIAAPRQNVLIVGLNPLADLFLYCAFRNSHSRIRAVGILSNADRHSGRYLRSLKILGRPEAIQDIVHDLSVHGVFVDRIIVALSSGELTEKARNSIVDLERTGKVFVDYLPAHFGLSGSSIDDREHGAILAAEHTSSPVNSYLPWKRLIDATVALVCIGCFTPLMIFVFALVLIDVGWPIIFWQQRPGASGRPIKILKFRTMGPPRNCVGRRLTDGERLSRIGRFLRRFRLDELPQIYNVLLGHMSLVGPRPLLPADQPGTPASRLSLRPGLTGWAQIKGGRHVSSEDKAALDLWYIKNASLGLDMMILAHTVRMILFGDRVDPKAIQEAWQTIRMGEPNAVRVDGTGHNPV